jgi:multiple sugar transport system substrate-binding protein
MKRVQTEILVTMILFVLMPYTWAGGKAESTKVAKQEQEATLKLPVWPDIETQTYGWVEAFQKTHPKVKFEYWNTDPAEYRRQIFVQLAGGAVIDLVNTQNNAVYADLASRGMLHPLKDFIERDKFDTSFMGPYFEGTKIKGVSYGLPSGSTAWVLFYNKSIFDKAGVPYPQDGMTWSDFYELAKRVTSGSGNNKIYGAYFHTWPILWMGQAVQTGATAVDQDLSPFKTAMEYRKRLEDEGIAVPYFESISSKAHYTTAFYTGNVAMVPMGNWFIEMLWKAKKEGKVNFDWDIVTMPVPKGVSKGATWGMAGPIAIASNSKQKEVAWEFLKFIVSSPEAALISAKRALLTFFQTPESQKLLLANAEANGGPNNLKILFETKIYPEYPALVGINTVINTIFKEEVDLYFAGEKTSEQALENIRKRIKELK